MTSRDGQRVQNQVVKSGRKAYSFVLTKNDDKFGYKTSIRIEHKDNRKR